MSLLKILAIVGLAIGIISLISEIRAKGQKSYALIVSLIVVSAALFVGAGLSAEQAVSQPVDSVAAGSAKADAKAEVAAKDDAKAEVVAKDDAKAEVAAKDDVKAEVVAKDDAKAEVVAKADAKAEVVAKDDIKVEVAAKTDAKAEVAAKDDVKAAAPNLLPPNALGPTAVAGADMDDAKIDEVIVFNARKSVKNAKGGKIASYRWDFGDGTTAEGVSVKHAYGQVGVYQAVLTVTDENGNAGQAVRKIEVNRPKSRIRFSSRTLRDVANAGSQEPVTGTFDKSYTGSTVSVEVGGYLSSTDKCECGLSLAVQGVDCAMTRAKNVSNEGEGELSVKVTCKGGIGPVNWTVRRDAVGTCGCTWSKIKIEGSES